MKSPVAQRPPWAGLPRIMAIDGHTHHAVHNVPLARLVFTPEHDGRLHRCAVDAIEAGHNVTSRSEKSEEEHGSTPSDERTGGSIPGHKMAQ